MFRKKQQVKKDEVPLPQGVEEHALEEQAREMIEGIITLEEKTAKEVMVPRVDAVFISCDAKKEEVAERIFSTGYSRYPIFKESIDNIVGILYVKDLLRIFYTGESLQIEDLIRRPYFVPETKRLDELLSEFKRRRLHIAIVVDEYGGVSGLLSMEDIIEHIVGDIQDEFDNETEDIVELAHGQFLCDARANLDYLNKKLSLEFPDEEFDTLGGFVFDLIGRVPILYEKIDHENVQFVVQQMDGNKVRKVKIIIQREVASESHS
ncbi:MAG: hemolysin family protein [Spirochaetia bacterium]